MKNVVFNFDNGTCHAHGHTKEELESAWHNISGQGNLDARGRGWACIIIPCDKETALVLSAIFHRHFAIETCCHWDGETLSMYCGDAGGGWKILRDKLNAAFCMSMPGGLFA